MLPVAVDPAACAARRTGAGVSYNRRVTAAVMSISESEVHDEVLDWFRGAWDPDLPLLEWRERLVESGWAVPSWSVDWFGRGLPA